MAGEKTTRAVAKKNSPAERRALEIAANLRTLREIRGWSQTEVCNRLGEQGVDIQQTTLTRIEQGSRPLKVVELLAFAELHGMPARMLISGRGMDNEMREIALEEATLTRLKAALDETRRSLQELADRATAEYDALEDANLGDLAFVDYDPDPQDEDV